MSEQLYLLADKISKQDNLATALPYIIVLQTMRPLGVVDPDYFYGDSDSCEIRYEGNEESEEKLPILYRYEDVNWFFTQEAAKKHIELNHYHYDRPRTYLKHCWRNPEMELLFKNLGVKKP